MEGRGTGDGPVALDRSDCPGLCFPLCTTRASFNQHFSNFVSQPTSVLGDIMGILKKKKKKFMAECVLGNAISRLDMSLY